MANKVYPSEVRAFHEFLSEKLGCGNEMTLDEAVAAFREHQSDLLRLREHLEPSLQQAERGETRPLDVDALLQRVHERIQRQAVSP